MKLVVCDDEEDDEEDEEDEEEEEEEEEEVLMVVFAVFGQTALEHGQIKMSGQEDETPLQLPLDAIRPQLTHSSIPVNLNTSTQWSIGWVGTGQSNESIFAAVSRAS